MKSDSLDPATLIAGQLDAASPILALMLRFGLALVAVLFAMTTFANAQRARSSSGSSGQHQTAEDLLRALQADRPVSAVIEPTSRAGKGPISEDPTLLPEGTILVERPGRLVQQGASWDFRPEQGDAIALLPNAHLESMVAMHNDAAGQLPFVVSGEVTVFAKRNYLLVKHFARGSVGGAERADSRPPQPTGVRGDAAAEDVLSALQSQQPGQSSAAQRDEAGAPTTGGGSLMDGALVVRRAGRLLHQVNRWAFEFEDEQASCQKVVAVLPNQSLEVMTHAAERGLSGLVFVVSGEMTQFGGENFLLVRGVTRRLDLGNLRP